jgi:hypothetical protein
MTLFWILPADEEKERVVCSSVAFFDVTWRLFWMTPRPR